MEYRIDYQYMPKGYDRPIDDGEVVGLHATDESGVVILPNVGDYVNISNTADGGQRVSFKGKVRTRYFSYQRITDEKVMCIINIVLQETDDDWRALIKE
jgi:hypothetical protein